MRPTNQRRRIVVTGYGGFLGTEITRQLLARGDHVVGFGRGSYGHLASLPIESIRGDVRDGRSVHDAIRGADGVIHTAALAGIWGPWKTYYEVNTLGTSHVIDACREHGVPILVYCSSPSVTFDGTDQSGIDESAPYPNQWLCPYPHTKALAEQQVLAAHDPPRLATVALRPHLIWGADDPHLFPRLIDRARKRRLRVIGTGTNTIDTVHVINAAAAHLDAFDTLWSQAAATQSDSDGGPERTVRAGGRPYFITQGEPVLCWEWIAQVLELAGATLPKGRIGFKTAWRLGATLEKLYRWSRWETEPPMTRFLAAQLAKDHYFDISAARTLLGYSPRISMHEGFELLKTAWKSAPLPP